MKSRKKKITQSIFCIVLTAFLVVFPLTTVIIYESVFGRRYETPSWMTYRVEEYEGLSVTRSDFLSDGVMLAGYQYASRADETRGVVVIAHGMGGGGHNAYMPFIDAFTANGYAVFAYDARGNDQSGGEDVEGLPQSVIDLDHALEHVKQTAEYADLPLFLLGHSCGGYASGAVLNLHPDVAAVVILAGFNESEDLLQYRGQKFTGTGGKLLMPYFEFYERMKFGRAYADLSAVDGMAGCDAEILIVHSMDDETVPARYGYEAFYDAFGGDDRFRFILYADRGHGYLFCSDEALEHQDRLHDAYAALVEAGGKDSDEAFENFMLWHMDRDACFELDASLLQEILALFEANC